MPASNIEVPPTFLRKHTLNALVICKYLARFDAVSTTNKTYADPGKSYRVLTVGRAVVSRSSQISSHVWPLQDLPVGFRRCDDHRPDSAFSPDETSQQNHSISYGEGQTSGAQHILYASLFLCLHSLQEGSYSM